MIFLEPYKKYAVFSGRSRRKEYWLFTLFYYIAIVVLSFIDGVIGTPGVITTLFVLITILPYIALGVRRLHDTERTGWWILISLIPVIGAIWFIVLCCLDSNPGENRFGKNPKEL